MSGLCKFGEFPRLGNRSFMLGQLGLSGKGFAASCRRMAVADEHSGVLLPKIPPGACPRIGSGLSTWNCTAIAALLVVDDVCPHHLLFAPCLRSAIPLT